MEYHQDRFIDFSLLFFNDEELWAVLPANIVRNSVYSHQGLTFGGLLFHPSISADETKSILKVLEFFLREKEITNITIKSIPQFYFKYPLIDLNKILIDSNYEIISRNHVLAIDYNEPLSIHKTKRKHYRNNKYDFEIKQSNNFNSFWNQILIPLLNDKYNTKPVHTLSEITMLSKSFPENIKQYDIYLEGEILAGITIFENEYVVKSQYGATTTKGQKTRALDYLFLHLINLFKESGKHFFSMGTVADDNYELGFNPGLLKQKEELGCTVFEQPIFKIEL